MTGPSFAPLLERFFTQRLMQQRQASAHTISSYGCGSFVTTPCDRESEGWDRFCGHLVHLPQSPFHAASAVARGIGGPG
jgi:hypothetical protein